MPKRSAAKKKPPRPHPAPILAAPSESTRRPGEIIGVRAPGAPDSQTVWLPHEEKRRERVALAEALAGALAEHFAPRRRRPAATTKAKPPLSLGRPPKITTEEWRTYAKPGLSDSKQAKHLSLALAPRTFTRDNARAARKRAAPL